MLCVSAIAWGVTYRLSMWGIAHLALLMVLRDFLGSGLVLATTTWYVCHAIALASLFYWWLLSVCRSRKPRRLFSRVFLMPSRPISNQSIGNTVEWAYAFDVHTNSFFPLYLALYLLQLFLSPLITHSRWICLWVGNTIYLVASVFQCGP